MDIKTVSLAVPAECPNNCEFCISNTRESKYEFPLHHGVYWDRLEKRLKFAKENNYNKLNFTGTGEPIHKKSYFEGFKAKNLNKIFKWMEIQTSGIGLDNEYLNYLKSFGISTISLSVIDMWNNENNFDIMNCKESLRYNLGKLCKKIKEKGFTLRLSVPMTDVLDDYAMEEWFDRCKELSTDQVVLRTLHMPDDSSLPQYKWIKKHSIGLNEVIAIEDYLKEGSLIYKFDYDQEIRSIKGMSVMIDKDCTGQKFSNKYLVIREDGKCYHRWDKKSSIIF